MCAWQTSGMAMLDMAHAYLQLLIMTETLGAVLEWKNEMNCT